MDNSGIVQLAFCYYYSRMGKAKNMRARFEKLFGAERLAGKLGAIFGVNEKELFRWERAEWPLYTVVTLELLEACPRPKWPESVRKPLQAFNEAA